MQDTLSLIIAPARLVYLGLTRQEDFQICRYYIISMSKARIQTLPSAYVLS
jgi:hypothetical protein